MKHDHHLFVKKPSRNPIVNSEQQPKTLRRSPRLLSHNTAPETQQPTIRKSPRLHQTSVPEDLKSPKSDSRNNNRVCSSDPSVQGHEDCPEKVSKKPSRSDSRSRNCANLSFGSRRSPRLNNGVEGFRSREDLRQTSVPEDLKSPKSDSRNNWVCFSDPSVQDHEDCPEKVSKKPSKSDSRSRNCANLSFGSRRSPRLNNGVEGFRSLRRFSNQKNDVGVVDELKGSPEKVLKKARKSDIGLSICGNQSSGSSKSSRLSSGVEGFQGLRRSQRVSNQRNMVDEHVKKNGNDKSSSCIDCVSSKVLDEEDLSDDGKAEVGVKSCQQIAGKCSIGREVVIAEGEGYKEIGVSRKRKRDEEDRGVNKGWTKEQELALQRAYLVAKPTPHFWKKVSKLVPGKSAQECFDKVYSDNLTPLQPRPRSRTKKTMSSPHQHFSFSASKLLKPIEPKVKRSSCNKQKTRLVQKTVRHLLQKQYHVDQDYETDLFSVLEPNMDPSTQAIQPSVLLSTPKQLQEKQGFLQKCRERSSSSHKKPLSKFSSSSVTALVSPPVLKQVKNRVLHEKYIDQLHCREAKRKAASARTEKSIIVKEDRKDIHVQNIDVVRAAKNALVSDARDVISKFQHLQSDAISNSDFNDDDGVDSDDDDER